MNPFERTMTGFRQVETRHGDTLQRIALRELGDAGRWYELASLNNLLPPYLTDDPAQASASVLLTGMPVMVPAATAAASAVTDPDAVFVVDVALHNGDLLAENGDFALQSGVGNLSQALRHRIETDLGELLYHPDYGCGVRELIGAGAGPQRMLVGVAFVKRALLSDPRVSAVRNAVVEISGDVMRIQADAVAINSVQVPVEI